MGVTRKETGAQKIFDVEGVRREIYFGKKERKLEEGPFAWQISVLFVIQKQVMSLQPYGWLHVNTTKAFQRPQYV